MKFSEDCLLLSTDWDSITEAFNRRAEAAGYTGVRKYSYVETFDVPAINPSIQAISNAMAYRLGQEIDKLVHQAYKGTL